MEYRKLGRSGLKVSAVGLGTGSPTFVGRADEATCLRIIDYAFDVGVTFFDTGETYAEGRSETLLGKALRNRRSEVVIATKFGKDRSVGPSEQRGSRNRVMKAIEGSLARLSTDYVDLYIIHEPDPETPIEETLGALNDLVREGKVRYLGCSEFHGWQLADALCVSRTRGFESIVAAGTEYNVMTRDAERELIPCCKEHGVGFIPTMPLAQGFLTGKYNRGHLSLPGTRFTTPPRYASPVRQDLQQYEHRLTEPNFALLDRLSELANGCGRTIKQLSYAWLFAHPFLSTIPMGVTSQAQLSENIADIDWKLTSEELDRIDAIVRP